MKHKNIKIDTCLGVLDIIIIKDNGHYPNYGTDNTGDLIPIGMIEYETFVAWDNNGHGIIVQEECYYDIEGSICRIADLIKKYKTDGL